MYDTLLDDFEDDAARASDVAESFSKLPVDESDEDGVSRLDRSDDEIELEKLKSEDELLAEEAESWSDDPVRMYLTQMG